MVFHYSACFLPWRVEGFQRICLGMCGGMSGWRFWRDEIVWLRGYGEGIVCGCAFWTGDAQTVSQLDLEGC